MIEVVVSFRSSQSRGTRTDWRNKEPVAATQEPP
jgi:hypothetical protein